MKILSIDIGIKNLAYVLLDDSSNTTNTIFNINKWDVINLCNNIPSCCRCKKSAKFYKKDKFYCKQHTKNEEYKIPTINLKTLNKQNAKTVLNIATENGIIFEQKTGKSEMIKVIEDYVNTTCFNIIETVNANTINLIDLGISMKTEFDKLFGEIDISTIDLILLENQISPIANRMKTIQGMIAQYFINCGNYNIEFFSAANKLKLFSDTKKTTYAERKKMSITYTQQLLAKKSMQTSLEFFNNHGKKDDLADCFLQGIYYLSTFNKLEI